MADKITVTSPDGEKERAVFDLPHVVERYEALGWKVKKSAPKKKSSVKPKTKADGSPITHPKDL